MFDRRTVLQSMGAGLAILPTPLRARPFDMRSYPAPDSELMVDVPGGRVYVRINGPLKGPRLPLLLIHGGPGGTHASLINSLALSDERAIILYDQLDTGKSDHPNNPANWTVSRFRDEVDAIRRALGVQRWHVFGHSWGGTVALEYAATAPQALAGLVLGSPLISTRTWLADAVALREQLPEDVQKRLSRCDPPGRECEVAMRSFYSSFTQRTPSSAAMQRYDAQSGKPNNHLYYTMWGSSEFVSSGTLRTYNGEPLLAKLNGARTLFMIGQHDEVRLATAASFADRVRGSDLAVIPGSAHLFLNDRPAEAVGLLRLWLRRQDG